MLADRVRMAGNPALMFGKPFLYNYGTFSDKWLLSYKNSGYGTFTKESNNMHIEIPDNFSLPLDVNVNIIPDIALTFPTTRKVKITYSHFGMLTQSFVGLVNSKTQDLYELYPNYTVLNQTPQTGETNTVEITFPAVSGTYYLGFCLSVYKSNIDYYGHLRIYSVEIS